MTSGAVWHNKMAKPVLRAATDGMYVHVQCEPSSHSHLGIMK